MHWQRAVAQLRLMVQLVEILVVVTVEAIFSNLEGLLDLLTLVRSLGSISAQYSRCQRLNSHIMSPNRHTHTHTHRLGRSDSSLSPCGVHIQPQQPSKEGALLGLLDSSTSSQASFSRLNQSQLSRLMPVLDTG
ncbi:hypothetical protein J3E69DRAFT_323072 [Trichoderma sp. SZMC 28015]